MNYTVYEKGFTLVELAIVMIIIGLLIAGVLKGQQMIENARITSTVSQIKGIDAATSTFRDMYSALPGDMRNPTTRLPNCIGNCTTAGNGNGRIQRNPGVTIPMNSESRAFFSHLAAADLITGVLSNPATLSWGDALPETEIGASGFAVGYTANGAATRLIGTPMRSGHYLSLRPSSAQIPASPGAGALTPTQAAQIDRKIDDGAPLSGSVRAAGNGSCVNGQVYRENSSRKDCSLFIGING